MVCDAQCYYCYSDLLDLIDGDGEILGDFPDEERQAPVSPTSTQIHHEEEIITSEQRSTQNDASLNEDDVPHITEEDDVIQSEKKREGLLDSEPANQNTEPDDDDEELIDSEPTNQTLEPDDDDEEEEELIDSEPANQSTEPPQDEETLRSELANQSLQIAEEEEERVESEPANLISEAAMEEEEEIIYSKPANQSHEFAQEEEEEEDADEDDARSAGDLFIY